MCDSAAEPNRLRRYIAGQSEGHDSGLPKTIGARYGDVLSIRNNVLSISPGSHYKSLISVARTRC